MLVRIWLRSHYSFCLSFSTSSSLPRGFLAASCALPAASEGLQADPEALPAALKMPLRSSLRPSLSFEKNHRLLWGYCSLRFNLDETSGEGNGTTDHAAIVRLFSFSRLLIGSVCQSDCLFSFVSQSVSLQKATFTDQKISDDQEICWNKSDDIPEISVI